MAVEKCKSQKESQKNKFSFGLQRQKIIVPLIKKAHLNDWF